MFYVSVKDHLECRVPLFQLFRTTGDLAEAHPERLGDLPLTHSFVEQLHQLPTTGNLLDLEFRQDADQEIPDQLPILDLGQNTCDLVDRFYFFTGVTIHRNVTTGKNVTL